MCDFCFNDEYYGFYTQSNFDEKSKEINVKLADNLISLLEDFHGNFRPYFSLGRFGIGGKSFPGCKRYKCNNCNQIWNLASPENAFRGFLLTDSHYKKVESSKERFLGKLKFVYILLLIFFILIGMCFS